MIMIWSVTDTGKDLFLSRGNVSFRISYFAAYMLARQLMKATEGKTCRNKEVKQK